MFKMITDIKEFKEVEGKYVAIAIRVSDDKGQKEEKLSIKNQTLNSLSVCERLNIKNYKTFTYFCSGYKLNTCKKFQEMVKECRDAKVSLIISMCSDRFMRNSAEYNMYIPLFVNQLDIPIYYYESNEVVKNVFALDKFKNQLDGSLNELRRNQDREKSLTNRKTKLQFGEWSGGAIPFGYYDINANKYDNKLHRKIPCELAINEEEAIIVRGIYNDIKTSTCSISALFRKYKKQNVLNNRSSIYSIIKNIKNKVYFGYIPYKDLFGKKELFKGKHPPILS